MLLCIEHIVLYACLGKHLGEYLGFFYGNGAHQYGLTLCVAFLYLLDGGAELGLFGLVHHIRVIYTDNGLVCGYLDDIQLVYLPEFVLLGHGCTGHAGELVIQAEEILEGDGGKSL